MKNFPNTSQAAEMRWNSSPVTERPQVLYNGYIKLPEVALPEKTWDEDLPSTLASKQTPRSV